MKKKVIKQFNTGDVIPEGAIFLSTIEKTEYLSRDTPMHFIVHFFLVEE